MVINYRGMAGDGKNHSWGIVAVSTMLELAKLGCEFKIQSTNAAKGDIGPLKFFPLYKEVAGRKVPYILPETDVGFAYTIPPNIRHINAKHRIVLANNDSSAVPPNWAKILNEQAHLVIPASTFAYDILKQAGVRPERMEIVPHGYDPEIFNPEVKLTGIGDNSLDDKFKFLCVAAPHKRKNIPGLLEAFIEEFKGNDDVALILKTSHNSHESNAPFHENLDKMIENLKKKYKYKWPKIVLVTKRVESLAGLYRYCDAMVLASRAECFSLTHLEAAMCKIPVVATDIGGQTDFLNQSNAYMVDYVMEKMPRDHQYHFYDPNAFHAKPLKDDLKRIMREISDNPEEAKAKAEKCYQDNKHLTWEHSAKLIIDLIKQRGWKI